MRDMGASCTIILAAELWAKKGYRFKGIFFRLMVR